MIAQLSRRIQNTVVGVACSLMLLALWLPWLGNARGIALLPIYRDRVGFIFLAGPTPAVLMVGYVLATLAVMWYAVFGHKTARFTVSFLLWTPGLAMLVIFLCTLDLAGAKSDGSMRVAQYTLGFWLSALLSGGLAAIGASLEPLRPEPPSVSTVWLLRPRGSARGKYLLLLGALYCAAAWRLAAVSRENFGPSWISALPRPVGTLATIVNIAWPALLVALVLWHSFLIYKVVHRLFFGVFLYASILFVAGWIYPAWQRGTAGLDRRVYLWIPYVVAGGAAITWVRGFAYTCPRCRIFYGGGGGATKDAGSAHETVLVRRSDGTSRTEYREYALTDEAVRCEHCDHRWTNTIRRRKWFR